MGDVAQQVGVLVHLARGGDEVHRGGRGVAEGLRCRAAPEHERALQERGVHRAGVDMGHRGRAGVVDQGREPQVVLPGVARGEARHPASAHGEAHAVDAVEVEGEVLGQELERGLGVRLRVVDPEVVLVRPKGSDDEPAALARGLHVVGVGDGVLRLLAVGMEEHEDGEGAGDLVGEPNDHALTPCRSGGAEADAVDAVADGQGVGPPAEGRRDLPADGRDEGVLGAQQVPVDAAQGCVGGPGGAPLGAGRCGEAGKGRRGEEESDSVHQGLGRAVWPRGGPPIKER